MGQCSETWDRLNFGFFFKIFGKKLLFDAALLNISKINWQLAGREHFVVLGAIFFCHQNVIKIFACGRTVNGNYKSEI